MVRATLNILLLASWLLLCASSATASGHTCTACGTEINGRYFETGGAFYHPEHFACAHCGKAITERYTVYRGQNYHTECFEQHVALRCAVCNGIIQGEYILDHWGNAYHTYHKGEVSMCDFCDRFIVGSLGEDMTRFRDGRVLCSICSATSVTNRKEALALMAQVTRQLERFGIRVNPGEVDLKLVDRDELRKLSGGRAHTTGFADYVVRKNLFGRVHEKQLRVYVLQGMPRIEMTATLAHELTHVWQFQAGHLDQDRTFSEGSCNFAAYLVLRKLGGEQAEFIIDTMLRDPDPIYGDGFRGVKEYVDREGLAGWIALMKSKNPDL